MSLAALPSLLLLLLLQLSSWQLSEADFGRDECTDLNISSCECAVLVSEYDISCPGQSFSPKFKITIRPGTKVMIECNITNPLEFKQMPQMRIGSIPMVQIKRCPLPFHTPIAGLLDNLGIINTHTMFFESNDLGMNVTSTHLERLQNLSRLRFVARRLSYVPEDLLRHLRNLSWLDMRSANLVELPARLLADMEYLEFLELGSNNLRQLPRGIFRDLHKLQHLNLWSNQLHNLSKHDFEGAQSVVDIDLHNNGIVQLRPDVFALLTNMTEINLNSNNFRSLPEGLFQHNLKLRQVKLQYNRSPLPELPSRLFANLPELGSLYLRCELESLPADIFQGSRKLENMTLMDNLLSTLPAHLLDDQENLLLLDLQRNRLRHLPDGVFDHQGKLQILNLADNQLTEISSKLFTRLANLTELYLSNNHLKTIRRNAFVGNPMLQQLHLANNRIDLQEYMALTYGDVGSPFNSLQSLQTLNLRNNSLMVIFSDWKYTMNELRELDLSYNNLTILENTDLVFLTKSQLQVNLTHNQIRTVHFYSSISNISTLDTDTSKLEHGIATLRVDLNDNPIDCDCTLLRFLQFARGEFQPDYAKKWIVSADRLKCQEPTALAERSMTSVHPRELLCNFDLTDNPRDRRCPAKCECFVRTFDSALIINCSNSDLTKIPKLPRLPPNLSLFELHVENNTLLKLPAYDAPGYANVTSLYLAGNNLTEVEESHLPRHLQYLDLRRNQLEQLNATVFSYLNSSMDKLQMRLADNPWVCDCDAADLLHYMQSKQDPVLDSFDLFCSDAEMPTRMIDLRKSDLCSQPRTLLIAIIVVISLTGFLIGISAAVYYKYQQEIKIWLYAHNLCLWLVTEADVDKDKKFDAFISYSHKDREFIENHLVPRLEGGNQKYKLCVHGRDWLVGGLITDNIFQSVADSRRTIIVLSPNFIESVWAKMEFQAAHKAALNDCVSRVIVIIYSDIGDHKQLPKDLQSYLTMNTYIKWDDPWFWDRLNYAMPHRGPTRNSTNGTLIKSLLKRSPDDKLELIKPSPVTPTLTTPPGETTKNPLVAKLNGSTPHTAIMIGNGNGNLSNLYVPNGKSHHGNGHVNGAFIINTNAKQSDV
ncbi:protein toll [Drosophila nasuta]|uniref:protein toll n=1 Tax=Drosophila nasuta TaxID=42062 RepID=UPI00295E437B|nr:protein toll [Drosophila nasuta]